MQVSVENISTLERKISVAVPGERIQGEIKNRLTSMTRTTRVQGFRPGKVPFKIIESRYGSKVRQEVIGEMVRTTLYEALTQENLKPANTPQIDQIDDNQGDDLNYTASFEVYPEIKLAAMDKLEIEKPTIDINAEEVSKMLEVLRKQHREFNVVDRASAIGDMLNIDFEGKIDGKIFEGGKAENYDIELGTHRFIAGFEEGLVGKSANDDVTLALKFPDDYHNEELKGKETEFNVHINEVKEAILPELNDALFEKYGVKEGGIDAFKAEIQKNMEREVEMVIRKKLKDAVLGALLDANQIELPKSLIHQAEHRIREELKQNMAQQGLAADAMDQADSSLFAEEANKRVTLQLILADIISKNKLKADASKVRAMIEQAASGYEDPSAVINWYYSDKKNLAEIEALALEDNVVDWIIEQAKVSNKAYTFDELMNKGQTAS